MSYFNIQVINRNAVWTISSIDFVKILRSFMDEKTILAQMCTSAKRGNKVVWFWQSSLSKIDMYHVKSAGGAKSTIIGSGVIADKLMRAYECNYARAQAIAPALVIDACVKDFDNYLSSFDIVPAAKLLTTLNGPLNIPSVVSTYELLFSTSRAIIDNESGSFVTQAFVSPDSGNIFELKYGQAHGNLGNQIQINGAYVSRPGEVFVPRSSALDIAAQDNILKLLVGEV